MCKTFRGPRVGDDERVGVKRASAEKGRAMMRLRRASTFAALCVLAAAAPARAECAWVLWWVKGSGEAGSHLDWEPQSAYTGEEACKKGLTGGRQLFRDYAFRCLPDTVDPRGSTTK